MSKVEGDSIRHDSDVIASTIIQLICDELKFEDMQNDSQYMFLNSRLKETKREMKKGKRKKRNFKNLAENHLKEEIAQQKVNLIQNIKIELTQ